MWSRHSRRSVPITDHVTWDLIPGERFSNLLRDPFGRRVRCHVDPDELSPSQADNDQYVELDKADGWNHQQIHGSNVRHMVAQKSTPTLTRPVAFLGHVLGDSRLGHRKAELEQLAMNVRRTPKPIVNAHPPDQRPQFCVDWWPASRGAGFPAPVAEKPGAMPAHNQCRLRVIHVGATQRRKSIHVRSTPNTDRNFDALAAVAMCQ